LKLRKRKSGSTKARAARKGGPVRWQQSFKIGDRVQIVDIPEDLKDPAYDSKDSDRREMRTAELFRFCLGRMFPVEGFGQYGHVELEVGKNRAVSKRFGRWQTIWMEPEFLKRVASSKGKHGPAERQL